MVSGPEKLASEAGLDMLKRGGNAIDAAVATGFALAVTLPRAGNIGGGGFMLVHLAESDEQVFIDYREMAPDSASRDMFLNEDGTVNKQMAYNSVSAAGIPGTVAGMIHALEKYGSLDLKTVIQPAIDLAEKGSKFPQPCTSICALPRNACPKMRRQIVSTSAVAAPHPPWVPYSNNLIWLRPSNVFAIRE